MKFAGKIATAFVLLVYVAAFAGFRLHECSVDHTVDVLILAGDTCQEVHHHHCEDAARCGHHHHHCAEDHYAEDSEAGGLLLSEADCCSNSLHCISDAQLSGEDGSYYAFQKCTIAASPLSAAIVASSMTDECHLSTSCRTSCFAAGRTALVMYSVRRV